MSQWINNDRSAEHNFAILLVTDKEMRVCMDPGGNGVTMSKGVEGGPGPPGGE
jgi:hypothetical protein